jgi:hypothetical protein
MHSFTKLEHKTTPNFSNSQNIQYIRLAKVTAPVFWDAGVTHIEFVALGTTINANTFCNMLQQFTRRQ